MSPVSKTRYIYKKNPIEQVICQFKFPDILKIAGGDIAIFQDKIRKVYPQYQGGSSFPMGGLPPFSGIIPMGFMPEHRFVSEDNYWFVALSSQSISLVSTDYVRYEDFKGKLEVVIQAFEEAFSPGYYSRVGLRYTNLISRSILGLETVPWEKLIPQEIFPEIHFEGSDSYDSIQKVATKNIDTGKMNLLYMLFQASGEFKNQKFSDEKIYRIDIDCYSEAKHETRSNIFDLLDRFNTTCRDQFRSSLTAELEQPMQPEPVA